MQLSHAVCFDLHLQRHQSFVALRLQARVSQRPPAGEGRMRRTAEKSVHGTAFSLHEIPQQHIGLPRSLCSGPMHRYMSVPPHGGDQCKSTTQHSAPNPIRGSDLHVPQSTSETGFIIGRTWASCRMSKSARNLIVADHCPAELRPQPPSKAPGAPPQRNDGWCLYDFVLHKQLGVGSASMVYQAVHRKTGCCVALKLYFKSRMTPLNAHQVQREVTIHARLVHPNIICMVRFHRPQLELSPVQQRAQPPHPPA
jgi:hypothetical protein